MPSLKRCLILSGCLLLSACTETIIKEVSPVDPDGSAPVSEPGSTSTLGATSNMIPVDPVSSGDSENPSLADPTDYYATEPSGTPTLGASSNMIPVDQESNGDTQNFSLEDPTDQSALVSPSEPLIDPQEINSADPDAGIIASPQTPQLQDPGVDTVSGTPGMKVDCARTLPCRWVSDDSQFSLTVTNADNIATRSRLSINYAITTSHDTDLIVSRAEDAIDSDNGQFRPTDQSLGGGNGGTPQGLVAGSSIDGTMNFDRGTTSDTLSFWSIAILDGGLIRTPQFSALPVGTVTTAQADCQNLLPCVWTTPNNDVAITLQSVGGVTIGNRLSANFSIETATAMTIAVDGGSAATGIDGTAFEGRTHSLGFDTDYQKVSRSITAGVPLYGSVNFFRTENTPAALKSLALIIYQDTPVPRWNPQFINVPIQ